jgi:hypothetical protein
MTARQFGVARRWRPVRTAGPAIVPFRPASHFGTRVRPCSVALAVTDTFAHGISWRRQRACFAAFAALG